MNPVTTIYLLDNDHSVCKGLNSLLTAAGYNVKIFSSIKDLLQIRSMNFPACIVMDTDVQEMDLHAEFSKEKINMPLIFLSAEGGSLLRKKAADLNAVGFFQKPVDGYALLDTIAWQVDMYNRNNSASREH